MDYSRTSEARQRTAARRESRRRKYVVHELDLSALMRELSGVTR